MLTYRQGPPRVRSGARRALGTRRYGVAAAGFEVELREFRAPAVVTSRARVSLVLVLEGDLRVATPTWAMTAPRGTALVWPAAVSAIRVTPQSATARWVRACPVGASSRRRPALPRN